MLKYFVAKNQPVVDIPNVTYEQIVVSQRFMKLMNQICSLMEATMRPQGRREWAAHRASTALTNGALSQCKGVHVQCCFDESRHILDHKLSCDIELPERTAFNQVSRIVGFSPTNREGFVVTNRGRRKSRSTYHTPKKTGWINAGEETRYILVDQDTIPVFGSLM